jgi:hypothetical protein
MIKRLLSGMLVAVMALSMLASPVLALANPDAISFGTGGTPLYKVFYNVLEANDWLVVAEGYVYYNESAYETLRPTGAGFETNLTPSAGANWQCVSDGADATYVSNNLTSYLRDLYELANSTVSSGVIVNLGVYFRIINSATGTAYGIPELYIGGNTYSGAAQTATTSWATKNQVYTTNPATGAGWTWNDINNLEIGVSLAATTNETRCSEVYAVVSYTRDNPGSAASEAFLFELLNTSGNVTIASTPLKNYGDKPISLYLTAAQVASASLTVGDACRVRITGNPLLFPSPTGNSVNATLGASDYVNQLLGADGGVATSNNLRNFLIGMAENIEDYDNPPTGSEYILTVTGVRYLTMTGGSIFLEGIPSLDVMCPILFQYSTAPMEGDKPVSTGAYTSTLSPLAKWGQTTADALTNLGIYLGINQVLAGSAVLVVLVAGLAVFAYVKTQSGISVLLLIGTTPFIGAWLGLMPMALAFIFVIVIVVLLGYFFLSRGAL